MSKIAQPQSIHTGLKAHPPSQFHLQPVPQGVEELIKRGVDVVLSILSIPVLTPIWIVLAVLIKLESRGPILFRQIRIGQGGRPFVLYKLRSMYHGAEDDTGPVWATFPDPRATCVGRLMRHIGLDETMQVMNVLKGEMSLVGPRPERPYFVERLRLQVENYDARLVARPGITGWAQIHADHKYDVSLPDVATKVGFDIEYIGRWSLWLDMRILAWTMLGILQIRRIPRRHR
ncbi:MAG: sugar transferase [Gemmatimonadota bacterium]|nr:sugar transferase [Gemmatimonadota bacterium]